MKFKNSSVLIAGALIVSLGVGLWAQRNPELWSSGRTPVKTQENAAADAPEATPLASGIPEADSAPPAGASSPLPPSVREEFTRAGMTDEDPDASSRRLDVLAERLESPARRELQRIVLDADSEGDERAVAVELLARSTNDEAVPLLESIALTPPPSSKNPQQSEFEKVLRARAIEGLGQHPSSDALTSLRRVADRTQDGFLLDRTRRALAARESGVPQPEEQDQEALRKILR